MAFRWSTTLTTGFRNQSLLLMNYLAKKGHEIHYFDHTSTGQNLMPGAELEDGTKFNFKVYGNGRQPYFSDILQSRLREIKPDFFGILLDSFMLYQSGFLNQDLSPARSSLWFPSDGGGILPDRCESILRKVNMPISMSKFGQKQAKDIHGIDCGYIPHGINIKDFYKFDDQKRHELRRRMGLDDKFVIGAIFRNQGRKMADRLFKTMYLIKDKIPNAVLFCHADPNDPAAAFNMGELINRYKLQNRIIFSGMTWHKGFTDKQMNDVYNLMDMKLDTTSGEGFGVTLIEAMATEVPVLVTDYTTTQEIIKDNQAGEGIKLSGTEQINMYEMHMNEYDQRMLNGTITGSWNVERGMCDVQDAAEKILKFYKDENLRKEYGKNGRKACLRDYDFEIVGKAWEDKIKELCK